MKLEKKAITLYIKRHIKISPSQLSQLKRQYTINSTRYIRISKPNPIPVSNR